MCYANKKKKVKVKKSNVAGVGAWWLCYYWSYSGLPPVAASPRKEKKMGELKAGKTQEAEKRSGKLYQKIN